VTVKLPGSGAILRAILWANAGDVKHDPLWIKIWSAYEGEDWKLIDVLDVRHLQGTRLLCITWCSYERSLMSHTESTKYN
jgi:hypothetical protein